MNSPRGCSSASRKSATSRTEPAHVLRLYGADDESNPTKAAFARNCILARRLIERGVRFVQLFNGAYASGGELNWDGHNKLKEQYDKHAAILDQPAAGLIRDLQQRGLLDDTLVVWCTEFGRMPMFQKGSQGRDHNPDGFTCWLTGAGVKPGVSHGVTDELGRQGRARTFTRSTTSTPRSCTCSDSITSNSLSSTTASCAA